MKGASAFAKCILAGEHAVLRGFPALVHPVKSLELTVEASPCAPGAESIEPPVLRRVVEGLLGEDRSRYSGLGFRMKSHIPLGAGLGSSAALAVAALRCLEGNGLWKGDLFESALKIEHEFHGRSSGIDIAGVLAEGPVLFRLGPSQETLSPTNIPYLLLTDSGSRAPTKQAVEQVQKMSSPPLDQQMGRATETLERAIRRGNPSVEPWVEAFDLARDCFQQWNLITEPMAVKEGELREAGALAVKPTGSGGGGFLLSVWREPPRSNLGFPVH